MIVNAEFNEISYEKKVFRVLRDFLIVSFVVAFFSSYIPYSVYVSSLCFFLLFLCRFKATCARALIATFFCCVVLFSGCLFSVQLEVSNTNYFYCVVYSLSVLVYLSICFCGDYCLSREDVIKICSIIVIFIVASCVYNTAFFIFNKTGIGLFGDVDDVYAVSYSAFYGNRNTFAIVLVIGSCPCLYLLSVKKNKIVLLCYVIILFNLFFTFSRTSIGAEIIILFFLWINKVSKGRMKIASMLFYLLIFIGVSALILYFSDFISRYLIRKEAGVSGRDELWKLALDYFFYEPICGFGGYSAESILSLNGYGVRSFHNTYLEILVDGGVLFSFFHLLIFREMLCKFRNTKYYDEDFYNIFLGGTISFAIANLFETNVLFAVGNKSELFTMVFYVLPFLYGKYCLKHNELNAQVTDSCRF